MKTQLFMSFVAAIAIAQLSTTVVRAEETLSLDDGNYVVSWNSSRTNNNIQFRLTVKTTGWVGLGFSENPNMTRADIFIGGIADERPNTPYYGDYYSDTNGRPNRDDHNQSNWILTASQSSQTEDQTKLLFWRPKVTNNDPNEGQDMPFTNREIYLIWAYGTTDEIQYHDGKRGFQEVNLLPDDEVATTPSGEDTTTTDSDSETTTRKDEVTTDGNVETTTRKDEVTTDGNGETTTRKDEVTTAGVSHATGFSVLLLLAISSVKVILVN